MMLSYLIKIYTNRIVQKLSKARSCVHALQGERFRTSFGFVLYPFWIEGETGIGKNTLSRFTFNPKQA